MYFKSFVCIDIAYNLFPTLEDTGLEKAKPGDNKS